MLLWPFGVYAGWVAIVAGRLHTLPVDPEQGRLSLPFVGLAQGMRSWSWVEVVCLASVLVLGAVAWVRAPGLEVRWLVAVSALFAVTMGSGVWRSWDFTRPLLPVTVVGACLLARLSPPLGDPLQLLGPDVGGQGGLEAQGDGRVGVALGGPGEGGHDALR